MLLHDRFHISVILSFYTIESAWTLKLYTGWIVDGITLRNGHFGGTGGNVHSFDIAAGETVQRISGTKIKFLGHDTIGQITITTSTGRVIGPYGSWGHDTIGQITITTSTGRVIGPYGHNGNPKSPSKTTSFSYNRQSSQRIFAAGQDFLEEIRFI